MSDGDAPVRAPVITRTLYQFPISHYCEKARWVLDHKGLDYRVVDLFPGTHMRVARRLGARRTVPIYVEQSRGMRVVVGDSTDLVLYVDRTYAAHPLLPSDEASRAEVLALEELFDVALGPAIRRLLYGLILDEPGLLPRTMFARASRTHRLVGHAMAPIFAHLLRKQFRIDRAGMRQSRDGIMAVLDRIEAKIDGDPTRYLVGDRFTLADLTAASLLAPAIAPLGSNWDMPSPPEPIASLRAEIRQRPAGQWALERYRLDRQRS